MSALYFYDDARARQFEPFALTRPACELRAGTSLIRRRWESATSLESAGFLSSPHLTHFEEGGAPRSVAAKAERSGVRRSPGASATGIAVRRWIRRHWQHPDQSRRSQDQGTMDE